MTKISKNIKRLRNINNMSQEALAEKLFVSRQAVSSWENNRTQPDIEMLQKLSEVFSVSIEELIYGEKRNIVIENEEPVRSNKVLIIVFSVLGSIFTAVGLVFFIFSGWQSFSTVVKSVLGILPMVIGQAAALFAFFKKRESIAWCESTAALWCIGVISTIALFNGIHDIQITTYFLSLIMAALILPMVYIFNVIVPLVPYYVLCIFVIASCDNAVIGIISGILLFALVIPFVVLNRKYENSLRHIFSVWLTVLAIFSALIAFVYVIEIWSDIFSFTSVFALFVAFFTGLLAYSKTRNFRKPYYLVGSVGSLVSLIILSYFGGDHLILYDGISDLLSMDISFWLSLGFKAYLSLSFIILGFFFSRNTFKKDVTKIITVVVGSIGAFLALITFDNFQVGAFVLSTVLAVTYIVFGARNMKFFELNIGLLAVFVLMFRVVFFFDLNLIAIGILFLSCGLALFVANICLIIKSKKDKSKSGNNSVEIGEGVDHNV